MKRPSARSFAILGPMLDIILGQAYDSGRQSVLDEQRAVTNGMGPRSEKGRTAARDEAIQNARTTAL